MRIAYVVRANLAQGTGVAQEIDGQTSAWRAAGNDERMFVLATSSDSRSFLACPADVVVAGGGLARLETSRELVRRAGRWHPDVVYLRYRTYQPGFSSLFEMAPVVIEINADDRKELRLVSRKSHTYNRATRR